MIGTTGKFLWFMVLLLCIGVCDSRRAWAQEDAPAGDEASADEGNKLESKKPEKIKPYDEVITAEATTDPGLFSVHRLEDKLFYEINPSEFDRDMLWVTQIEQTQAGYSYAGMPVGDRVVRWELREEDVLLRDVKYTIRADVDDPIKLAVEHTSVAAIIKVFPVKAWGKDKSPVIDVTDLFLSDQDEFSPKRALGASGLDRKRTFLEDVKSFPTNIETKVLATYKPSSDRANSGIVLPGRTRRDATQSGVTIVLHHSMVRLPDEPMKPRRHDERVGFFNVGFQDYGDQQRHQVENIRYITRWRLEKRDPQADVSEPVKPIVFYVGRGVPEKWQPWIKQGIEMWQPAFETAGFKNAIIGKVAPTEREDPDWDAEDARISTIRWLPSQTENAFGPHVHDPRTGEILEADVRMYHNVMKLVRDWYFVQASPNDERAQKLPLPDDLMGELLAYVVAHEVGHSLGFPHNMKASSTFTVEQLRDPEFTKKNGTSASIMDYGRFNYVAQPGDGAALIPRVGPYDQFAVEWGYRQFAADADEKAELEKIVKRQIDDPMLRFGDANPREDPSQQTEDLGSDTVAATELGLKNVTRVAGYLVTATCNEGEDYSLLENMYDQLIAQRNRELGHVVNVVGGVVKQNLFYGDADQVYFPVDVERQRRAVAFLREHALRTPAELIDPAITLRIEADGAADRILAGQSSVLRELMNEDRVKRMSEQAYRIGDAEAYTPAEMLADVRGDIWRDLDGQSVVIDLYRRNLQRAHAQLLMSKLKDRESSSDLSGLARAELRAILLMIEAGASAAGDDETRAHLREIDAWIREALDPRGVEDRG